MCQRTAVELGLRIDFRQTNSEGTLVDYLHEAHPSSGHHHQSDKLTRIRLSPSTRRLHACDMPIYEVHISNTWKRDSFRHTRASGTLGKIGWQDNDVMSATHEETLGRGLFHSPMALF